MDDEELRLLDLTPDQTIRVYCQCGRITEFRHGYLQRMRRLPSTFLVYDLQFRLKCKHCNARQGFKITIFDEKFRTVNPDRQPPERLVVGAEATVLKLVPGRKG